MTLKVNNLHLGGAGGSLGEIISVTNTDHDWSSANNTTYSWGSQSIGAAPTGTNRRFVVVIAHMMEENPNFHVSTKINGSTADFTVVEAEGNSIASTAISYSEISSGTTATVTTTYDNGAAAAGVGVYSIITNSFGLDVYDFAKDETRATTMSTTIDSRSDGVVIAGATNRNGGSISMTIDPSTTSEDYDQAMQSTDNMMTAITQFPTTTAVGKSITAESSVFPDDSSLAAVCFIPGS